MSSTAEKKFPYLFSPGRIGRLQLPNRLVMPAMATNLASERGGVTEDLIAYYSRRAGEAALITIENCNVDYPGGCNGATQLRIDDARFVPGLFQLVERIHEKGSRVSLQLNHAGAVSRHKDAAGPSSEDGDKIVRGLQPDEIWEIAGKFAAAAERAKGAGFDAVEIHAGHAYLIAQFLSFVWNRRGDEFGGPMENRMRFLMLILQKTRKAVGRDYPLIVRISGEEFVEKGRRLEETVEIARRLEGAGIDAIHVTAGTGPSAQTLEPMGYDQGWKVYLAERVKQYVRLPVITVGVIREPEFAEMVVSSGKADFVAIGRGMIADPDWVSKAKAGDTAGIRKCISCNQCVDHRVFKNIPIRCSVNPRAGKERYTVVPDASCKDSKLVAVAGGGPAGMQAAITAARRGHRVILYEKEMQLGGQALLASVPPGKQKIQWLLEYLQGELKRYNVSVRCGTLATEDIILQDRPDVLVVATGAEPVKPEMPVTVQNVLTAHDVLGRKGAYPGKQIVVVGGGAVGCETACFLAAGGARVTIVELLEDVATELEPISRKELLEELRLHGVQIWRKSKFLGCSATEVTIEQKGEKIRLASDLVVVALGSRSRRPLAETPVPLAPKVLIVGDARQPGRIIQATGDGYRAGITL